MTKHNTNSRHIDMLYEGHIGDEVLLNMYSSFQPTGSGPLSTMRVICALIEQIAKDRGLELPPARGVK